MPQTPTADSNPVFHWCCLTNGKKGNNPMCVHKWHLLYTTVMPLTPTSQLLLIFTAINQTAITLEEYLWAKSWHFHIITIPNITAVNVLPIFQHSLRCTFHFQWFTYLITFQWWQQQTCFLLAIKAAFVLSVTVTAHVTETWCKHQGQKEKKWKRKKGKEREIMV